ncbi:MAG TPA: DUF483 domain-containing protein [Polyangiaceae bacterium]
MTHLVLVATSDAGSRWRQAIERTPGARLVAELTAPVASPRWSAGIRAVLEAHAGASAVVALPSPVLGEVAALLAELGVRALFDPLEARPPAAVTPEGTLAAAWCNTLGAAEIALAHRRHGATSLLLRCSGAPGHATDDLELVLLHAFWLLDSTIGDLEVTAAGFGASDAELLLDAWAGACRVKLSAQAGEPSLAARLAGKDWGLSWRCERGFEERVHSRAGAHARRHDACAPGCERALEDFVALARPEDGAERRTERIAGALAAVRAALGRPLAPSEVCFARSRAAREGDSIAAFGLAGELPAGQPLVGQRGVSLPWPAEVLAFRAGLKPVAFLTLRPEEVEPVLRQFEGVHVERRERSVSVGAQDRWCDRRDTGEPRVELYISRDAALAREASALQAERDPTRSLVRLGELLGYPACCIDAFRRQGDRSNNSRNRYESAARTRGQPWCAELDNLELVLLPFYPCGYRCESALEQARRWLAALRSEAPGVHFALETALGSPVLYFEHGELVRFPGALSDGGSVEYSRVVVPEGASSALCRLAGALARGNRLDLSDERLLVTRGGHALFELDRIDPALGFLAPFTPLAPRSPAKSD